MEVGLGLSLICLAICISLSARLTKMDRLLKKSGIGLEKSASLYNVLVKNINKKGTLTYYSGSTLLGNKKISCQILDVDEEWILLEDTKKHCQQLLHMDSVVSVQM